jgi:hypothetical protein
MSLQTTLKEVFGISDEYVKSDYDMVLDTTLKGINDSEDLSTETKQQYVSDFNIKVAEFNKVFNIESETPVLDYIVKMLQMNLTEEQINKIIEVYGSVEFATFHSVIDESLKTYADKLCDILDTQYGFEEDKPTVN